MRTCALVTVRNSSSRLPEKPLKLICGKRSIDHVIERAKLIGTKVMIVTSTDQSDHIFEEIAKFHGIDIFRGALVNKLKRWNDCFDAFDIDNAVIVEGDDIMHDFEISCRALEQIKNGTDDIIFSPQKAICGLFAFTISRKAFSKLSSYTTNDGLDTDVIQEFVKMAGLLVGEVELNSWEQNRPYRLTMDYEEDYQMFEALVAGVGTAASGRQVVDFLDRNPEIVAINSSRHQDWLENQRTFNQNIREEFLA